MGAKERCFMKILIIVLVLNLMLALTGCGHETPTTDVTPDPTPNSPSIASNDPTPAPTIVASTPTPTPTATPTPNPTVQTFIFQNVTICTFLHSWDPNTVSIKTYATSGNGPIYYMLTWQGVFLYDSTSCINGCVSPDITFTRSTINGTVCTFSVHNGQYVGVTP
jgi:hypothetical protein